MSKKKQKKNYYSGLNHVHVESEKEKESKDSKRVQVICRYVFTGG